MSISLEDYLPQVIVFSFHNIKFNFSISPPAFHVSRRTYPILIQLDTVVKQPI